MNLSRPSLADRTSRRSWAPVAVLVVFVGCVAPPAAKAPAPQAPATSARVDAGGFAQAAFRPVRSDRLGVSLPLPDRDAWSIVDRAEQLGGFFVATHAPSSTTVRVRRYDETTIVGRLECDLRAQLAGELPKPEQLDGGKLTTLADEPIHRPAGWDGRRWIGFESVAGGRLVGRVVLASGRGRSCLIVHARTEVAGDFDAEVLADRLELLSSRVVSAVAVDSAKAPELLIPSPSKSP